MGRLGTSRARLVGVWGRFWEAPENFFERFGEHLGRLFGMLSRYPFRNRPGFDFEPNLKFFGWMFSVIFEDRKDMHARMSKPPKSF